MPKIYLSPSTQEFNEYVNGGTEEEYMNLIADAMIPYLKASGLEFTRNTPDMTAASSIRQSNEGDYDLHLALHSNAAPESLSGQLQGTDVYYYPTSVEGERAAIIFVDNLKDIYLNPDRVRALTTTRLGEVSRTRAPGVLIEFAYHDNVEDANWIKNNIDQIAANVVLSLTEFFGIPFVPPRNPEQGVVSIRSGRLNVRSAPSLGAPVIATLGDGDIVTVWGRWNDWYVIQFDNTTGYSFADYIQTY